MELTKEQHDIINSTGNIKINAVAGSGKTTTVIEYAKTRPNESKILYLAFNKSVKLEAIRKFEKQGLSYVKVETAHSLAYKHIVFANRYSVKAQGYKTNELVEILNLQGNGEKHAEYIIANHINKFVAYFCNSDKRKVQELNYLDIVNDDNAKEFVSALYPYIEKQTRIFLDKMNKGEIEITHDFYLKKFQLSNPILHYDFILFDEGQDASPAMLDVFLKQNATKVIVGDTHQQIYGWRYAVNSLEKADFQTFYLSTSFRFSQDIANLAVDILQWKKHFTSHKPFVITGKGATRGHKVKAVIARTNLGLLLKAIEYITEKENIKNIYFEGNINSYTYAEDGASLYDILKLYNGQKTTIKDKLIKEMKDIEELESYIEKTEDAQLAMMLEVVKEYGNEIPKIIQSIKDKHIDNNDKESAEIIFSTVHRCKGMEYDTVQIVNDFINEEKIEKIKTEFKTTEASIAKINEEINLLYVAVTRTKNSVYIAETLMPKNFPKSSQIHWTKVKSEVDKSEVPANKSNSSPPKPKEFKKLSETTQNQATDAYQPWTKELDKELKTMFLEGISLKDMAIYFGRTKGAVGSRIKKLELEYLYK